ncbi:uncharacterized protein LOC129591925 [Paramacrobiotus metropolitanus]|uniref:uncharacterized protein LOC129591925 n=1 Tax=Paramacrobiotus metropolitanus TaxID=2943436 RepID=UPI0024460E46|nr:uncharacterized protein LOC129591925 [Paramacrobiotus metropolitanus]
MIQRCLGKPYLILCIIIVWTFVNLSDVVASSARPCWCQDETNNEEPLFQIVGITPNRTMALQNVELFTNILKSPIVGNKKIAIVGIVGKYRGGKSTLLNIVHRYLLCLPKNVSNQDMSMDSWLYEREDFPSCRNVFGTASTSKGFTKGLWITRQPVILPDENGDDVAVFLIDTQGMMDNINNQAAESPLFYLTSMLSSTLIINTMGVLDRQLTDLVGSLTLQVTSAMAKENFAGAGKMLQQLVFLVRDWDLEHEYGWHGGKAYLQEYFEMDQERSASVSQELEAGYNNVSCFLMPKIAASTKNLKILPSILADDFGPECESFLDNLFKAPHIQPKKVFGKAVKGTQFVQHVELYSNMFKNGTLQSVGDVYSLQLDLMVRESIAAIVNKYRDDMNAFLTDLEEVTDEDLMNIHQYHYAQGLVALRNTTILTRKQAILEKGLGIYNKTTKALHAEYSRQQQEKRTILMERLRGIARASVELAKQQYRARMEEDIAKNFYNIPELMEQHTKWKNAMKEMYLTNNTEIKRKSEIHNEAVFLFNTETDLLADDFVRTIVREEEELNSAIIDAEHEYVKIMDESLVELPLPEYVLQEKSSKASRSVRNRFLQTRVLKSKPATIPYHDEMLDVLLQNESRKYFDDNYNKTESLRASIPELTETLERFGTALLTTGIHAMTFSGDPVFTTASGVISSLAQIIRMIVLLSNADRPDPKFQRMIQEFTVLNDRLSLVEARMVQYHTISPIKEEYRGHLQAMSNIKNKVDAMMRNSNNATRDEFLRVCEQYAPDSILTWMRDRVSGQYHNILGDFLFDIVQGIGYNRTAYGLWMQSIMALDTQTVMYRLMYMQLSGKFDNSTIAFQTEYMKTQVRSIYEALKATDAHLKAAYPSQQLQHDIKSQLLTAKSQGLGTNSAAKKLQEYLTTKYPWVHWMVALHVQTCYYDFYRAVAIKNPLDAMSGVKSGMLFVPSVGDWNALVAWKSEQDLRATPNREREMFSLQREIHTYAQQDRWEPTVVRGIRNAGKFLEGVLKAHLDIARMSWSGVAVVKKECELVVEAPVNDRRFFASFTEGYECTFAKMPFVCGWIVMSGEAHIIVFPEADPNSDAYLNEETSVIIHPAVNVN